MVRLHTTGRQAFPSPQKFARLACRCWHLLPINFPVDPLFSSGAKPTVTSPRQSNSEETLPNMRHENIDIHNLVQLRKFVSRTLCQINDFEEGIFQVSERILIKCGEKCGILFCLHGPRSVKLTAVWETITNSINFYDSTGEKIQKTVLPLPVAARE